MDASMKPLSGLMKVVTCGATMSMHVCMQKLAWTYICTIRHHLNSNSFSYDIKQCFEYLGTDVRICNKSSTKLNAVADTISSETKPG